MEKIEMNLIKPAGIVILILCLAGIGYGYWGVFTKSGSKMYEEMDGMIPFFVLLGSVAALFIWLVYYTYRFIRSRKSPY
ncbi:MAG: hypothetical protein ACXVPQ_13015 [Bacteroidia bacterium]